MRFTGLRLSIRSLKKYTNPFSVIPTYIILSLSKDEGPIINSSFDRLRMTAEYIHSFETFSATC